MFNPVPCLITVKIKDKYASIYCHRNGDPINVGGAGQILKKSYSTMSQVIKLMRLGDVSILGHAPISDPDAWLPNADLSKRDKCRAYRESTDTRVDAFVNYSQSELRKYAQACDVDFIYLYMNNRWYVADLTKYDERQFKFF